MSILKNRYEYFRGRKLASALALLACFFFTAKTTEAAVKFDRTYNTKGNAHLTISNINGAIKVTAWNKKTISVSAINEPSAPITEQVTGDDIVLSVKKSVPPGKVDFQIYVPAETALTLKNYLGKIEVRGTRGDVNIKSYDSEVRLVDVRIPSADVNVTTGDIFFDGDLTGDGPYKFQTLKGDLDISLPASTPFQLSSQALSENINLGDFMNSLTATNKAPKGISGTHLQGGPRILLHKK
jgi:hypothetical protein